MVGKKTEVNHNPEFIIVESKLVAYEWHKDDLDMGAGNTVDDAFSNLADCVENDGNELEDGNTFWVYQRVSKKQLVRNFRLEDAE